MSSLRGPLDWGNRGALRNARQVLSERARVEADLEAQLRLIAQRADGTMDASTIPIEMSRRSRSGTVPAATRAPSSGAGPATPASTSDSAPSAAS